MVGLISERAVAVIGRSNVVAGERKREREREREREDGGAGAGGEKGEGREEDKEGEEELEEQIFVKTSLFSLHFICHSEALCAKNLKMTHIADGCSNCKSDSLKFS